MAIGNTSIIQPIITEISMVQANKGWYSFKVQASADKRLITQDLKRLYNVDTVEVRTMKRIGKMRRSGKKMTLTRKSDWKKAVVKLKSGQRIPVFEITDQGTAK